MTDEHGRRETPAIVELDDLEHNRHSHEFVGAAHGDVPFSISRADDFLCPAMCNESIDEPGPGR